MTEVQDQTLEGGAGGSEDLNLGQDGTPPAEGTEGKGGGSGGDPLDDIKDETVRAEAKAHRAIARRHAKKGGEGDAPPEPPPTKPAAPAAPASSEFLTKKDFHKSNEREAIRIATAEKGVIGPDGEVLATAEEVKENWNSIVLGFTSRRGKDTSKDILEDITDAVILWKGRQKKPKTGDNGARDLSTTSVGSGSGTPHKGKETAPALSGIKTAVQPADWFPKKS